MPVKLYNLDIWVYNRIKFFSDKGLECFESNDSMASLFGRHKNRISASIQKLTKECYIKNLGTNKYNRRLTTTEKEINICGVTIDKNGVTLNKNSDNLTPTLDKAIDKNGVTELTKTVLALDKNGDIYKELYKYFINEYLKEEKKIKENKEEKLSHDFILSEETKNTLQKEGYGQEQIDKTLINFKDYWINGDGKGKRKTNWQSTFRNWIRKNKPWKTEEHFINRPKF